MNWKAPRHRIEWLAIRALAVLIPSLPRRICHLLADALGTVAAYVHLPGRRVAQANLDAVFGSSLSPARRDRLVTASYRYFSRAMADLFWSERVTAQNVRSFIDLDELDQLRQRDGSEPRGHIFACLHYAGFEWIALALGLSGIPCTVVTNGFKNPLLNQTFNKLREVAGHQTIRREGAMLRLFKALRNNRSVTLAVDLTVSAKLPSVPIRCFGMETCVTFAPAWLQRRTGAPIIPTYCEPLPGGRYRLVLLPPIEAGSGETLQQVAQRCWTQLEPVIIRDPGPWLWMYKHWRYRPDYPERPYPDYANVSPHFRILLERRDKEREMKHAPPATAAS